MLVGPVPVRIRVRGYVLAASSRYDETLILRCLYVADEIQESLPVWHTEVRVDINHEFDPKFLAMYTQGKWHEIDWSAHAVLYLQGRHSLAWAASPEPTQLQFYKAEAADKLQTIERLLSPLGY